MVAAADCCFMVSGSISLELLVRNKPAVVIYRLSHISHLVVRAVLRCPYITLPNLIAGRPLMPEFLFGGSPAPYVPQMTDIINDWIEHPAHLQERKQEMEVICKQVAKTGATERAAAAILKHIAAPTEERLAA